MFLNVRNGVINSDNFAITSGDSYLKLDLVNLRKDDLNASVNGKVDLSLLGLSPRLSRICAGTPRFRWICGARSLNRRFRNRLRRKRLRKIHRNFIIPFECAGRCAAQRQPNSVEFSTRRPGRRKGGGRRQNHFPRRNTPGGHKGTFGDVRLNIPEGFRTRGSGTVAIRGPQFPYTMDINYQVTGGEVVYEFGDPVSSEQSVKASAYLPRAFYIRIPFTRSRSWWT